MQAILDGRSRRVDCQQLDMTGLDDKPLRRVSVNTVMAGFGPDANAVAERRRWMGPMRYSISVALGLGLGLGLGYSFSVARSSHAALSSQP